ncbi:hypothetical protein HPB47_002115, partial [Ixodes persulcatus]
TCRFAGSSLTVESSTIFLIFGWKLEMHRFGNTLLPQLETPSTLCPEQLSIGVRFIDKAGDEACVQEQFSDIMKTACDAANRLGVVISVPRQASCETHRENYGIQSPAEYYRVAIYVPYLDSLAASLTRRFSETNAKSYRLLLHPARMKHMSHNEFVALAEEVQNFYCIDIFKEEITSWYE